MRKAILTSFALFSLVITSFGGSSVAYASETNGVAEVADFSKVAKKMAQRRLPLVLMFSSEHCVFCMRVENDFLVPMQISGDYEDRALIRKLRIDFGNEVIDFAGRRVDADEFAARYNISVTPTVVFLDHHGNQLAAKRVGLMTPDFYGGYLDESIATALDMLRRNKPLRVSANEGP